MSVRDCLGHIDILSDDFRRSCNSKQESQGVKHFSLMSNRIDIVQREWTMTIASKGYSVHEGGLHDRKLRENRGSPSLSPLLYRT